MMSDVLERIQREQEEQATAWRAKLPRDDSGQLRCDKCSTAITETDGWCAECARRRDEAEKRKRRVEAIGRWWHDCAKGAHEDGNSRDLGVPPTWPWADFTNEAWRKRCNPKVLDAIENWDPSKGSLFIIAESGEGKSSGIRAWLSRLAAQATEAAKAGTEPYTPHWLYTTGWELAEAAKRRRLGDDEHPLEREAMYRKVLFLDELNAHVPPGGLGTIADLRYSRGLVTLTCSGLTKAELATTYGGATLRKLVEGGRLLDVLGGK